MGWAAAARQPRRRTLQHALWVERSARARPRRFRGPVPGMVPEPSATPGLDGPPLFEIKHEYTGEHLFEDRRQTGRRYRTSRAPGTGGAVLENAGHPARKS